MEPPGQDQQQPSFNPEAAPVSQSMMDNVIAKFPGPVAEPSATVQSVVNMKSRGAKGRKEVVVRWSDGTQAVVLRYDGDLGSPLLAESELVGKTYDQIGDLVAARILERSVRVSEYVLDLKRQ